MTAGTVGQGTGGALVEENSQDRTKSSTQEYREVQFGMATDMQQTEGSSTAGPDTVIGVLESMIREVIAEEDFGAILDSLLTDATPHFVQYEDSPPPGGQRAPASEMVAETLKMLEEEAGLPGADFPDVEDDDVFPWRSDLLLDFESPDLTGLAPAEEEAQPSASKTATAASIEVAASPSSAVGDDTAGFEETPQGYWEDAEQQYGEVDLETLRRDAGEVLEGMLLDMVDDVVSGKLNWMRPLPRPKQRR